MVLKRVAFAWLGLSLFGLSACGQAGSGKANGPSANYQRLLSTLYRNTVPTVTPTALAAELRQPGRLLLLDARSPAEFGVSHLRGARFINYDSVATERLVGVDRSQPVVVYCSVGYRSERLGERLHVLGFKQVRNLYGGMFEWVNEGFPVYNAKGLTPNIHPYSPLWSPWLKQGRKVYE